VVASGACCPKAPAAAHGATSNPLERSRACRKKGSGGMGCGIGEEHQQRQTLASARELASIRRRSVSLLLPQQVFKEEGARPPRAAGALPGRRGWSFRRRTKKH